MFGFYTIDVDYLEFLNSIDSEVEYSSTYKTSSQEKLFLGIITDVNNQKYFIPLTSAKRQHANPKLSLSSKNHMLIYEQVDAQVKNKYPKKFYRTTEDPDTFLRVISCLLFNKAIPVPDDMYSFLEINDVTDTDYKNMLLKEYSFCLSNKDEILETASNTIKAIKSGKNVKFACNLDLLDKEMNNFKK